MMKASTLIALAFSLLLPAIAHAEATGTADLASRTTGIWQPGPTGTQTPIWPRGLTIAPPATPGPEAFGPTRSQIAGRPMVMVEHVSVPTMTIYRPTTNNTGAAVVVFPGGGYQVLAIDLEGTEVCDWLTAKGVTCVVLKYRVPGSGPYWAKECNCRREPKEPMALQDAQRTISLLRQQASSLGIDPHKIGVVGFSAGGRMVVDVSNHMERSYNPVDEADKQSVRPDFAMALYPGHVWKKPGLTLEKDVKIDPKAPPTFIAQAADDATDDVRESLTYYLVLEQAGVPVEMHLYAEGGHAFGIRERAEAITHWTTLAETWMRGLGVLP